MNTKKFKVDKLIRDKLPESLESKGIKLQFKNLDSEEWVYQLKKKLLEEAAEVNQAQNQEELIEELADLVEVTQALSSAIGSTMQQVEKKRVEKRQLKGGFDAKVYCEEIEVEENHPSIHDYLNKSDQYPEITHSNLDNCLFCQMAQGQKDVSYLSKFKHCYAIEDRFPVSPGHVLFIPYQHTDNWLLLTRKSVKISCML